MPGKKKINMGPLSSPDGAVLEIIGNRKELKHSIGGELRGASTKSGDFGNITGLSRGKRCVDSKTWRCAGSMDHAAPRVPQRIAPERPPVEGDQIFLRRGSPWMTRMAVTVGGGRRGAQPRAGGRAGSASAR